MPYKAALLDLCYWAWNEAEYTKSPMSGGDIASSAAIIQKSQHRHRCCYLTAHTAPAPCTTAILQCDLCLRSS